MIYLSHHKQRVKPKVYGHGHKLDEGGRVLDRGSDGRSLAERYLELAVKADLAAGVERIILHAKRTALLAAVPTYRLPEVLDNIARGAVI